MSTQAADQTDLLANVEKLTTDLAARDTSLATANASILALTGERDKARTDLATANATIGTLTGERDKSKTDLAAANGTVTTLTTENTQLKADMSDFNKRVNAELAKRGIRMDAAKLGTEPKSKDKDKDSEPKMTATERVIAARGVSSVEELEGKR